MLLCVYCRTEDWFSKYAAQGRRNASSRVTVFPLYAPTEQGILHAKVDPHNCGDILVAEGLPAIMIWMPDGNQQQMVSSMYCHM